MSSKMDKRLYIGILLSAFVLVSITFYLREFYIREQILFTSKDWFQLFLFFIPVSIIACMLIAVIYVVKQLKEVVGGLQVENKSLKDCIVDLKKQNNSLMEQLNRLFVKLMEMMIKTEDNLTDQIRDSQEITIRRTNRDCEDEGNEK